MSRLGNKREITLTAEGGFMLPFDAKEVADFLRNDEKFMTAKKGINRDLVEFMYGEGATVGDDDAFDKFVAAYIDSKVDVAHIGKFKELAKEWFYGDKTPSRTWAIKLCFAFKLSDEEAARFMWKVCKLSGFCYRCAEDVIYCYCLANKLPYDKAVELIADYKTNNPHFNDSATYRKVVVERIKNGAPEDEWTLRTQTLRTEYTRSNLLLWKPDDFINKLKARSKYFIGFNVSAHVGVVEAYNSVVAELKRGRPADVGLGGVTAEKIQKKKDANGKPVISYSYAEIPLSEVGVFDVVNDANVSERLLDGGYDITYESVCKELLERDKLDLETDERETRPLTAVTSICNRIAEMLAFIDAGKLAKLMKASSAANATDREIDHARKIFVFLNFARYVLKWERYLYDLTVKEEPIPDNKTFFETFHDTLDERLEICGYPYLYVAHGFDWHILNCVRSLDDNLTGGEDGGIDAMTLFNEALVLLAESDGGDDDGE